MGCKASDQQLMRDLCSFFESAHSLKRQIFLPSLWHGFKIGSLRGFMCVRQYTFSVYPLVCPSNSEEIRSGTAVVMQVLEASAWEGDVVQKA